MPTTINGKEYRMVHERLSQFLSDKENYDGWYCGAEPVTDFGEFIVFRGYVLDADGKQRAHAYAAERHGTSNVNRGSHIENCETSAIGRALAHLSPELMGDSIASADELVNQMTVHDVYAELLLLMLLGQDDENLRMRAFIRYKDLSDEMKTDVFNHAPQGLKVKWKDLVRAMEKAGHQIINDKSNLLKDAWDDPETLFDLWQDCTQYEKEALEMLILEEDMVAYLNSLTGGSNE